MEIMAVTKAVPPIHNERCIYGEIKFNLMKKIN